MSKTKVLTVLFVLVPIMMFADFREHLDRIEFGPTAGVGFYVGQKNPTGDLDLVRVQSYDLLAFGEERHLGWPGIETFGFSVGYRFDTRWQLQAKTTRQRLSFAEYDYAGGGKGIRGLYYNAMWHVDLMAEFNILNYGNKMQPDMGLYNVVPYVGLGLGCTMFNQNATLRAVNGGDHNERDINTLYPQVGKMYKGKDDQGQSLTDPNKIGLGLYVPVAFGVKWRINDNVQLKGQFQYQLYFSTSGAGGLNSNLEGATNASYYQTNKPRTDASFQGRPTFEQLAKYTVGKNHDCLFSLSAIFNLEKWKEERLVTY